MKTQNKLKAVVLAIMGFMAISGLSVAQSKTSTETKVKSEDENLVSDAYASGLSEIKIAESVKARTVSTELKDLTGTLITDHSNLNNKLRTLAGNKKISLDSEISSSIQKDIESLQKISGMELDKAYLDMLVDSHKKAVTLYEKGARSNDHEIKAYFADALPKIKHHQEMIIQLDAKMDKDMNRGSVK